MTQAELDAMGVALEIAIADSAGVTASDVDVITINVLPLQIVFAFVVSLTAYCGTNTCEDKDNLASALFTRVTGSLNDEIKSGAFVGNLQSSGIPALASAVGQQTKWFSTSIYTK